jgi:hypothetical protein
VVSVRVTTPREQIKKTCKEIGKRTVRVFNWYNLRRPSILRAVRDFQQRHESVISEAKLAKMWNVMLHLKLPLDKVKASAT